MITASAPNLWAIAGLIYALAGAGLLCAALFNHSAPASALLTTPSSTTRSIQKALTEQRFDGRLGALLLFLGFFLQASGLVGGPGLHTPAVLILLGLALALSFYGLSKDLLVEQALDQTATAATAAKVVVVEKPAPVTEKTEPVIVPAPKVEHLRVVAVAEEA